MKNMRRMWELVTVVCILSAIFFCASAFAEETLQNGGSCGDQGENVVWSFDSSSGKLTISGSGRMANFGYYGPWHDDRASITSVEIADGVESIGKYAFFECEFTEVTIPDSVTEIGQNAFRKCSKLKEVTIPNSVKSIGTYAFAECRDLTGVRLPENDDLTSISSYMFYTCSSLREVTIPDNVTEIKGSAFALCSSLSSVTIPDSVTSIGSSAFSTCKSLTSITIPRSVTSIGVSAFISCPDGLTITCDCDSYARTYAGKNKINVLLRHGRFVDGICERCKDPETVTQPIPPETGDSTDLPLLMILMIVSVGIAVLTMTVNKKEKN